MQTVLCKKKNTQKSVSEKERTYIKCVTSVNDVIETLYLLKLFEYYNRNRALALYLISEGNTHEHFGI